MRTGWCETRIWKALVSMIWIQSYLEKGLTNYVDVDTTQSITYCQSNSENAYEGR